MSRGAASERAQAGAFLNASPTRIEPSHTRGRQIHGRRLSIRSRVVGIALIACATLSCGCAAHPVQPTVPLQQHFDLRVGASATLPDGVKVRFDGVTSDSRCPLDVVCVWAGEGVVAVSLSQTPAMPVQRELRTTPDGSEATYASHTIKLVALAPYPKSAQPIRPAECRHTQRRRSLTRPPQPTDEDVALDL